MKEAKRRIRDRDQTRGKQKEKISDLLFLSVVDSFAKLQFNAVSGLQFWDPFMM